MDGPNPGAPMVELPERVDRRIRLGPFPTARDALKFVCYAAVGAVLAPFVEPLAWVPVLALGFVVSVWRPDGEAVDERATKWLLFQVRRATRAPVTPGRAPPEAPGSILRLANGRSVTIVRAVGLPLAYRPPADLVVLFDRFRDLLRATEGALIVRSTTVALRAGPVLPGETLGSAGERAAHAGYRELVAVLCRRRRARRVDIALGGAPPGPEGGQRLEDRTRTLLDQLNSLGLHATVLRGRSLAESAREFGWVLPRGPS